MDPTRAARLAVDGIGRDDARTSVAQGCGFASKLRPIPAVRPL